MIMNLILLKTRFLGGVQTSEHFEFLSSFQHMCHVSEKNWPGIQPQKLGHHLCNFKPDLLSLRLPASDNAFVSILCEKDGIFETRNTTARAWNFVGWKRKDVRWSLLTGDIPTINRFDLCSKVDTLRIDIYGNIIYKAQWDFLCFSITSHTP